MISKKYSVSADTEKMIDALDAANKLHSLLLDFELGDKSDHVIEKRISDLMNPIFKHVYDAIIGNIDDCLYNKNNVI